MHVVVVGRILAALGEGHPPFALPGLLPAVGDAPGRHLPPSAHEAEVVGRRQSLLHRAGVPLEGRQLFELAPHLIGDPVGHGGAGEQGEGLLAHGVGQAVFPAFAHVGDAAAQGGLFVVFFE